jgi:hypothetical protein
MMDHQERITAPVFFCLVLALALVAGCRRQPVILSDSSGRHVLFAGRACVGYFTEIDKALVITFYAGAAKISPSDDSTNAIEILISYPSELANRACSLPAHCKAAGALLSPVGSGSIKAIGGALLLSRPSDYANGPLTALKGELLLQNTNQSPGEGITWRLQLSEVTLVRNDHFTLESLSGLYLKTSPLAQALLGRVEASAPERNR